MRLGVALARQEDRCGPVDDTRRVAGVVDVGDVEIGILLVDQLTERRVVVVPVVGDLGKAGGQRRQRLGRRPRTGELLLVEGHRAVEIEHRDQALVEAALGDRPGGAGLRLRGQCVERLATDALERRDRVGAHALVRLRVDLLEVRVAGAHREQALLRQRHHLAAAADHEVLHARHDRVGGDVGGGDARAAEAVEGHAAGPDVVTGVEGRHTTEVAALLAHLRAGAPDHVVDVGGVEVVALGESFEHGAAEVLGVQVRQSALALLADATRGTAGVDDQCVRHGRQHGASSYCRDGHRGKLEP